MAARVTRSELPAPPCGRTGWPWTEACTPLPPEAPSGRPWPTISIVTPSLNQGEFLEETIRSVLLQGYPNLEYIVIDGGSSDDSLEILQRYSDYLSGWLSEPDRGHANALNKGFARTSGDIMAWINSDDVYLPDALRVVGEVFDAFPEVRWLTSALPGSGPGPLAYTLGSAPGFSRRFFYRGGYLGFPYSTSWIQQESTFWTRALWLESGACLNDSLELAVDFELWSRFFRRAPLVTVEAPLACFRLQPNQRSLRQWAKYREEAQRFIDESVPVFLPAAAKLFKTLRLYKLVTWGRIASLLYGDTVPAVVAADPRGWRLTSRYVA